MRIRLLAWAILVFAAVDLVLLTLAPMFGWVPLADQATPWAVVALAMAFFLALLAMIGAISILVTDFPEHATVHGWDLSCTECGRAPDLALAFCDHCGAGTY